jgi:hypothetical protein
MKEAWASWMVRPYFQLNGTSNDGGLIWVDDISTDNMWNSTLLPLMKEFVPTPVQNKMTVASPYSILHSVVNNRIQFNVYLSKPDHIHLSAYDLRGRKFWEYSNFGIGGMNVITMEKSAPGHYIMKLDLKDQKISESKMIEVFQ